MAPKRGPTDAGFAERLVAAMEMRRVTPSALAEQGGWDRVTVSRWRGGRLPDDNNFRRLATHLRISLVWLKDGQGEATDYTAAVAPVRVVRESREALGYLGVQRPDVAERVARITQELLALEAELLTPTRLPVAGGAGAEATAEAAAAPRSHGPGQSRPA